MSSDVGPRDIEVQKEDQLNINKYSQMNQRYSELEKSIGDYKNQVQSVSDALEEVMITMEPDALKMRFGDSFFATSEEAATARLEKAKKELEDSLRKATDEIEELSGEMEVVKKKLNAKFGDSINLERDR